MQNRTRYILCVIFTLMFSSCLKEETGDRRKIIEMTVYPEYGYSGYFMSDNTWGEFYMISENDSNGKRALTNTITEGFDAFDYEQGYEYKLKVEKILMANPPQDVSSVKYVYLETLSKEKVILTYQESEIQLKVYPQKVSFIPHLADEAIDALLVKEMAGDERKVIPEIEGFNFQEGYDYSIQVEKSVQANPYKVSYKLIRILSKDEAS